VTGRAWHALRGYWASLRILLLCHREARRRRHEDEAIALTRPPAPGAAHRPRPAPGTSLTPWERGVLNDLLANPESPLPPQARANGREIADMARRMLPHLSDRDLGRVILHAYWWAATFHHVMPPAAAMHATLDALGAAACELTELDRQDVPR